MIYIFLLLLLTLLVGVTAFFFISLKDKEVPANVGLIIDAWNTVCDKETESGINDFRCTGTKNQG